MFVLVVVQFIEVSFHERWWWIYYNISYSFAEWVTNLRSRMSRGWIRVFLSLCWIISIKVRLRVLITFVLWCTRLAEHWLFFQIPGLSYLLSGRKGLLRLGICRSWLLYLLGGIFLFWNIRNSWVWLVWLSGRRLTCFFIWRTRRSLGKWFLRVRLWLLSGDD